MSKVMSSTQTELNKRLALAIKTPLPFEIPKDVKIYPKLSKLLGNRVNTKKLITLSYMMNYRLLMMWAAYSVGFEKESSRGERGTRFVLYVFILFVVEVLGKSEVRTVGISKKTLIAAAANALFDNGPGIIYLLNRYQLGFWSNVCGAIYFSNLYRTLKGKSVGRLDTLLALLSQVDGCETWFLLAIRSILDMVYYMEKKVFYTVLGSKVMAHQHLAMNDCLGKLSEIGLRTCQIGIINGKICKHAVARVGRNPVSKMIHHARLMEELHWEFRMALSNETEMYKMFLSCILYFVGIFPESLLCTRIRGTIEEDRSI